MNRRTTEAYVNALKFINQNIIELEGGIIIDFENAMRAALKIVCPNLAILGCLFHHCQALQRKMKSMPELFQLIRTNEKARTLFRKIQCMALLPADEIMNGFENLQKLKNSSNSLLFFNITKPDGLKK